MPQALRPVIIGAALLLRMTAARSVEAASTPVRLDWVAPDGCPSRSEVLADIEQTLGEIEASTAVDAHVVIRQDDGTFRAKVDLGASGTDTTREFAADSCRAVATVATLVIALAVNPDITRTEHPAEPPKPPRAGSAGGPASTTTPLGGRGVFVGASFVVDTALVPSTTFGVELAIAYNPAHFDVEFAAALFASQMATLAAIPSQGASFGLEQVGVRACYEPFDARFDLGPCAGAWYDQIAAHGFGSAPDHPTDATGKIFAASAGGRATVRLSTRVAVRFLGEAIAPAVRPTFIIDGGGLVYHLPAVSLRVAAGAEAHF